MGMRVSGGAAAVDVPFAVLDPDPDVEAVEVAIGVMVCEKEATDV